MGQVVQTVCQRPGESDEEIASKHDWGSARSQTTVTIMRLSQGGQCAGSEAFHMVVPFALESDSILTKTYEFTRLGREETLESGVDWRKVYWGLAAWRA